MSNTKVCVGYSTIHVVRDEIKYARYDFYLANRAGNVWIMFQSEVVEDMRRETRTVQRVNESDPFAYTAKQALTPDDYTRIFEETVASVKDLSTNVVLSKWVELEMAIQRMRVELHGLDLALKFKRSKS